VRPAETPEGDQAPPRIESFPVVSVAVDSLVFSGSPRRAGEDQQHIRLLAQAPGTLPPIVVHRETMRVIDGFHRVRAARSRGVATIAARLVDCDEDTAFVLAVEANVTHGLPLSRLDRAAAAERIIASHPHWSDRAIGAASGLSDKTVSAIRARCGAPLTARMGRDGRVRPLDVGRRRELAATEMRERPGAGLREIARATGLSPATVRDVRQRIDRGEHPVPARYRRSGEQSAPDPRATAGSAADRSPGEQSALQARGTAGSVAYRGSGVQSGPESCAIAGSAADRDPAEQSGSDLRAIAGSAAYRSPGGQARVPASPTTLAPRAGAVIAIEPRQLLNQLSSDPTLRHSEAGRRSLHLLHRHLVCGEQLTHLNRGLPDHWAPHVAHLARACAGAWHQLADQLQRRAA
jgi:ParB-like chromosome segregation protein Spo0J